MLLQNSKSNKIWAKYKKLKIYNFPIINNYKYLGIFLDNNINLKANTKYIIDKMLKNDKILKT